LTTAVRLPVAVGCVVNVTVNEFAEVTKVTVPKAPLLKATVLLLAVDEKFVPVIVIVEALMARFVVLGVTVGAATMVATWVVLLIPPKDATTALRMPVVLGCVVRFTVNWVDVAEVIAPEAPLLKVNVLLLGVVSNPDPLIIKVSVALIARAAELRVTVGAATMVAT